MKLSEAEYEALINKRTIAKTVKQAKFRNIKKVVDGHTFDSVKEAKRYVELKLLERSGAIEGLELQPKFELDINGHHICNYFADFAFFTAEEFAGVYHVEDVKGMQTPVYRLKKKLMKAIRGIDIEEI